MKKLVIVVILTLIFSLFSTSSLASGISIDRNDVLKIWRGGYYVLTKDGNVYSISIKRNSIELEYLNIKSIVERNFIISNSGSIIDINVAGHPYSLSNNWNNLQLFTSAYSFAVGLTTNGVWITKGDMPAFASAIENWTDIVSLEAGYKHIVGLKSDGTVVATGSNSKGQCNVSKWNNIIQICAYCNTTIGLRADGTVVATGENNNGQTEVFNWSDVVQIGGGSGYGIAESTSAVTKDGRILTTDQKIYIPEDYRCENVKEIILEEEILIVHNDNTIDLFATEGHDKSAKELMQVFNNGETISLNNIQNKTESSSNTKKDSYSKEECTDIALSYMKTHISPYLKNPSSLQINGTTCINGEGTTFWIVIDYSAMNSLGGYNRDNYYCQVDYKTGKVLSGGTL